MAKYRKKPVVIEAMQYGPYTTVTVELAQFLKQSERPIKAVSEGLIIDTLEGQMLATPGDWIIRGVAGEFYPCSPDIFKETYEAVE